MASEKILSLKKEVVSEITGKIKNSESVILFSYQGLTVADMSILRRRLREVNAEVKIYKNTLLKIALDGLKLDLTDFMEGPNALVFGADLLEPIKVISDFANENKKMEIRVGILSGDVADIATIKEYASIPSRDGLLTMLAGGMIQYVKDLSIGLNLYAEMLPGDGSEAKPVEEVKEEPAVAEEVTSETTTEESVEEQPEQTEEVPVEAETSAEEAQTEESN